MKIAHLIPTHPIFTKGRVEFLHTHCNQYPIHSFIFETVQNKVDYYVDKKTTIHSCMSRKNMKNIIISILNSYDIVVFDSLFLDPMIKIELLFNKINFKKIVWIEWGFDLYLSTPDSFWGYIKYSAKRFLQFFFDRKIPFFVSIYPTDASAYKQIIGGSAKIMFAPYRLGLTNYEYANRCAQKETLVDNNLISIQIGHNAAPFLKHIEILKRLECYKNENIIIYLPLCYGTKNYADKVEKYAKSMYKEKVVVMRNVLPYEEYIKILKSIDIFILNSKRQIALGNIHQFLRQGSKIFLPRESILSKFYKKQGIEIFDIEEIGKHTFKQIANVVELESQINWIRNYDSIDPVEAWNKVFDQLLLSLKK